MAHNVFGEMYGGMRVPAWHKLGQTWDTPKTPGEAIQAIGADYNIVKTPLLASVDMGGGQQMLQSLDGQFALMREPTATDSEWAHVGWATDRYNVIQNTEIADFMEPLADKWPLETVGVLGKGEEIFMTLSLGEWEVKGEAIQEYFLMHNASNGRQGLSMAYTPVRVVCQNTLISGLGKARVSARLSHSRHIREDIGFRVGLLKDLQTAALAGREAFTLLSEMVLQADDVTNVLAQLYPDAKQSKRLAAVDGQDYSAVSEGFRRLIEDAKVGYEYDRNKAEAQRETTRMLFGRFNDEFPNTANTGWALYNAAVEYADWRKPKAGEPWEAALFGDRAKDKAKAFELVYALR